ncbi:MAG: Ig-like domain-containing protein, partial [Thermodesulfovibrionales bacterium]
MKKIFLLLAMLIFSIGLLSCGGGGGSGSADLPPGENPGSPSVVQLWPSHYIAQTNAYITLYAKVLDGNGAPVPNVDVSFTNLSGVGTLSKTSAKTDGTGLAQVTLSSTTPGFSTILAQVNTSQGIVRDRKSIFFSTRDVLAVSMDMDVDSVPGNGTFNETSDFILFENASDDTFKVRTTVYDAGGVPVPGTSVNWSASHGEVTFVRTDLMTNSQGWAEGVFKVEPSSIRNTETTINIMAYAGNDAANMVTLFLRPVVIDRNTSYVTAASTVVDVGKTTNITAVVMLSTGHPAPDGVTVNFTTTCGTVTPFAQTTGGVAQATFTAPTTVPAGGTCTVTASVSGTEIGSVTITIKAPLKVIPDSATVDPGG